RLGFLEVEHDRAFAGVELAEHRALAIALHRAAAHQVALGRFDLDHVGAHVGQQAATMRPGDGGREVEDFDVGERPRMGVCHECHRAIRIRTTPPTTRRLANHSPAEGRSLRTTCDAMKVNTSSIWPTARTRAAFSSVMASAQPAEPSTLKMPTQTEERQLNHTLPSCGLSRQAR